MRIAQLAPLYEAVPPPRYGGTERIVAGLTEELVRDGHDVVLFASGDSVTSAELVACCRRGLRLDPGVRDPIAHYMVQLGKLIERAAEFDVIHNHIDFLAFPVAAALRLPMLTTLHGDPSAPDLAPVYHQYPDTRVVAISDAQRRSFPLARWLGTVYNGIQLGHFTLREQPGSYLAFLGRVSPEKGMVEAIELARMLDMPLKIAAKVDPFDKAYFADTIRPMLRDPRLEYIGEIDEVQKNEFLGHAYAYLFPIRWREPFGITMVESMACGTPVIALAQGSVPEVVVDGRTGFICRTLEEMGQAVRRVDQISRRACRTHVERRFSVGKMAASYEALYQRIVARRQASGKAEWPPRAAAAARHAVPAGEDVPALRLPAGRNGITTPEA